MLLGALEDLPPEATALDPIPLVVFEGENSGNWHHRRLYRVAFHVELSWETGGTIIVEAVEFDPRELGDDPEAIELRAGGVLAVLRHKVERKAAQWANVS